MPWLKGAFGWCWSWGQPQIMQDIFISQLCVPGMGISMPPNRLQKSCVSRLVRSRGARFPSSPAELAELTEGLTSLSLQGRTMATGLISTFRWVSSNFSTIPALIYHSQILWLSELSPKSPFWTYLLTCKQLFLIKYFIGMNKVFVYSSQQKHEESWKHHSSLAKDVEMCFRWVPHSPSWHWYSGPLDLCSWILGTWKNTFADLRNPESPREEIDMKQLHKKCMYLMEGSVENRRRDLYQPQ